MRKAITIFIGIWIALLLLLALGVVVPRLFGVLPKVMRSSSMEPTLPIGSLLYVSAAPIEEIQEGQIITFRAGNGTELVTHRVEFVRKDTREFIVKGDGNLEADANYVPYDDVVGIVTCFMPGVGYLHIWTTPLYGKVIAILLFLILLTSFFLMRNAEKKQRWECFLAKRECSLQEEANRQKQSYKWPLPPVRIGIKPGDAVSAPTKQWGAEMKKLHRNELLQLILLQEKEIRSLRKQLEEMKNTCLPPSQTIVCGSA